MTEQMLGSIPIVGMLFLTLGAWLYMSGGRSGKWKRRFLASFVISSGVWLECYLVGKFTWPLVFIYPLCVGSFVLGYGADVWGDKVRKRSIVVAASLMSGLLLAYNLEAWAVFPLEVVIASLTVYLGVRNPLQAAPEEFFICVLLWMPKLMYPFV